VGHPISSARSVRAIDAGINDGHCDGARVAAAGPRSGQPGKEIEGPMAIVILGGLITSTALNLVVLPTLALRFGRFATSEQD